MKLSANSEERIGLVANIEDFTSQHVDILEKPGNPFRTSQDVLPSGKRLHFAIENGQWNSWLTH